MGEIYIKGLFRTCYIVRFMEGAISEKQVDAFKEGITRYCEWKIDSSPLSFQEKDILQGRGSISNNEAEEIVRGVYDTFNAKRKQLDAQIADAEDLKMLEDLEKNILEKDKNE